MAGSACLAKDEPFHKGYRTVFPDLVVTRRALFHAMERVQVFIDGANFFGCLRGIKNTYTDTKFDFERFIQHVVGKRTLVKTLYYNASLKQDKNPLLFRKQQQFFDRLRKINRFAVILCKRQRREDKDGKEYYSIKGDDIHLAIDMLKDAYEDEYDTAILISSDGDFAPVVKYVRAKNKQVENYYFQNSISLDLIHQCNDAKVITKKTVNKFFYRSS